MNLAAPKTRLKSVVEPGVARVGLPCTRSKDATEGACGIATANSKSTAAVSPPLGGGGFWPCRNRARSQLTTTLHVLAPLSRAFDDLKSSSADTVAFPEPHVSSSPFPTILSRVTNLAFVLGVLVFGFCVFFVCSGAVLLGFLVRNSLFTSLR